MKMVLQFGFGDVFSWENQEMKQKQKKHPIFRFKTTCFRGVFLLRISSLLSVVALQFCQPFCIWLCVQSLGPCASI